MLDGSSGAVVVDKYPRGAQLAKKFVGRARQCEGRIGGTDVDGDDAGPYSAGSAA
jgi:hypothetical protein